MAAANEASVRRLLRMENAMDERAGYPGHHALYNGKRAYR